MEAMVVIACERYGEKTGNNYCSHEELKRAYEKKIPIFVVRMCVDWPPSPKPSKNDLNGLGAALNKFVFSQGLCTLRWHDREWNSDECAKEIEEAFINQRGDAGKIKDEINEGVGSEESKCIEIQPLSCEADNAAALYDRARAPTTFYGISDFRRSNACTRAMLYVSFVSKYIKHGWTIFFNFTESEGARPSRPSSPSLPMNEIGDNQDDLHFQDEQISDFPLSNSLSTNEASRPLNQDASSSASAKRSDQGVKTDFMPIGVANDVCQGKSDATLFSYKSSDVEVMARTKTCDTSKSNLDSTEEIPTFYPLKLTVGMSKDDPFIYESGIAPKVPFIVISPNVEEIQDNAFEYNDVIERLVIPKSITIMGGRTLWQCSNLKHVIFEEGSSLRHIGGGAFRWCPMIEEMNLPASLETLGHSAFNRCRRLKKVTLSPKMTKIEGFTFGGCSSLTAVEGMNDIQSIGEWAFYNCSSLETIDVNQSAVINGSAFNSCYALTINRIN
jgi:hypothetical protein